MRAASQSQTTENRVRVSLRRLLEAVDRALSAAQEVAQAKAALVREADRLQTVRLAPQEEGIGNDD